MSEREKNLIFSEKKMKKGVDKGDLEWYINQALETRQRETRKFKKIEKSS